MQKNNGPPRVIEHSIPLAWRGKGLPDLSQFSSLGFDSVSVFRKGATARRVQGTDISGRPYLFTEIAIDRSRLLLRYSCPEGFDERLRGMHACLLLLYVLQAQPALRPDPSALASALCPALEAAAKAASAPYEQLSKKCADLQAERAELSSQNARLLRASEEAAGSCMVLEQAAARLRARIEKLESVPDAALREMLLDWLATHRGAFDAPLFCKSSGIWPARCEEGLEMLLKSGAIRKGGHHTYFPAQVPQPRQFEVSQGKPAGLLGLASGLLQKKP